MFEKCVPIDVTIDYLGISFLVIISLIKIDDDGYDVRKEKESSRVRMCQI